jgi:hypothetical protein
VCFNAIVIFDAADAYFSYFAQNDRDYMGHPKGALVLSSSSTTHMLESSETLLVATP